MPDKKKSPKAKKEYTLRSIQKNSPKSQSKVSERGNRGLQRLRTLGRNSGK